MDIHTLLVRGRNRLAAGYLLKGRLCDHRGGHCARGAHREELRPYAGELMDGAEWRELQMGCDRALADALDVPRQDNWQDFNQWAIYAGALINFNNAESTTKEDVLALFDKAIAATAPEPDTEFLNNVADPVAA